MIQRSPLKPVNSQLENMQTVMAKLQQRKNMFTLQDREGVRNNVRFPRIEKIEYTNFSKCSWINNLISQYFHFCRIFLQTNTKIVTLIISFWLLISEKNSEVGRQHLEPLMSYSVIVFHSSNQRWLYCPSLVCSAFSPNTSN